MFEQNLPSSFVSIRKYRVEYIRLVFTSDGVVLGVIKSLMNYSENRNVESQADSLARRDRSRKNENVSISSDSVSDSVAYDPVKTILSGLEAEAKKPTNCKA